jgi:hypothetical protein
MIIRAEWGKIIGVEGRRPWKRLWFSQGELISGPNPTKTNDISIQIFLHLSSQTQNKQFRTSEFRWFVQPNAWILSFPRHSFSSTGLLVSPIGKQTGKSIAFDSTHFPDQ